MFKDRLSSFKKEFTLVYFLEKAMIFYKNSSKQNKTSPPSAPCSSCGSDSELALCSIIVVLLSCFDLLLLMSFILSSVNSC